MTFLEIKQNLNEITGGYLIAFRPAIAVGIFAASSIFSAACGGSQTSDNRSAANADKSKTVETRVAPAIVREIPKFIQTTGSFAADETTEVAPEIAGRVESVLVGEGDFVRANSIIIKLSERDARLRLAQSKAAEAQARAQIQQAEAQVRQARAQIGLDKGDAFAQNNVPAVREARAALASAESDLKLAQTNERRYANLLDTGDTSKIVYDGRRNELDKA
nr:biotin/lipoyl-binding protein [Acidobacteriota bacterium]